MRLFVAIALPDDVRTHLAAALRTARSGPHQPPADPHRAPPSPSDHAALEAGAGQAGLRWGAPERWHLTLCFLGEVAESRIDAVTVSVGRKIPRYGPLGLHLAGAGRFGRRVLWVGVTGDVDRLGRLAAAVGAGARRAHVDVEDRPYRPHLTVARGNGTADLDPLVARLASYRSPVWTASAVLLVRSHLGPRPVHEPLTTWPLTGAN